MQRHGLESETLVKADPWEASWGLRGWDLQVCDRFARAIEADPKTPSRHRVALHSALHTACTTEGHTFVPWGDLLSQSSQSLAVPTWAESPDSASLESAAREMEARGLLVIDEVGEGGGNTSHKSSISDSARCYSRQLFDAEVRARIWVCQA